MSVTAKALWYIESHLDADLSLDAVAEAAGASRFHLSRAFPLSTGVSLGEYTRARRLSEAAKRLMNGAPDILAVALDSGYGSHEAFTRAFRQHFGVTPEQARSHAHLNSPQHNGAVRGRAKGFRHGRARILRVRHGAAPALCCWNITLQEPIRMDQAAFMSIAAPRIVTEDAKLIFGIARRCPRVGDPGIPAQWNRFLPHFGHIQGQIGTVAYGVIYNSEDAGQYDYLCGVEVREFPAHPADFARLRIPAQTYAVFDHKEHVSAIAGTWKAIWEQGLSGLEAQDGPSFERYGEQFEGRTGLGGVEIWIPVKATAGGKAS